MLPLSSQVHAFYLGGHSQVSLDCQHTKHDPSAAAAAESANIRDTWLPSCMLSQGNGLIVLTSVNCAYLPFAHNWWLALRPLGANNPWMWQRMHSLQLAQASFSPEVSKLALLLDATSLEHLESIHGIKCPSSRNQWSAGFTMVRATHFAMPQSSG